MVIFIAFYPFHFFHSFVVGPHFPRTQEELIAPRADQDGRNWTRHRRLWGEARSIDQVNGTICDIQIEIRPPVVKPDRIFTVEPAARRIVVSGAVIP